MLALRKSGTNVPIGPIGLSGVLATSAMESEGSRSSVVLYYGERLSTLQGLLQSLHVEWQQYRDSVECASVRSRYHAPVEHRPFGRPRFLIQPDQLEYLRSLSFTWVEIASLLLRFSHDHLPPSC